MYRVFILYIVAVSLLFEILALAILKAVSAPLIGKPTPNVEATSTTSQVPVSSTSSVSVELLSAWRPHRRCHDPESSDQTSSASRVEGEASQPPEIGCLHIPNELKDRPKDWEWLCKHFTNPKFVKKSIAGQKVRESKTLFHHFGLQPFSYRLEARREGSKFPEIDMFKDVYVRPGNETTKQLHMNGQLRAQGKVMRTCVERVQELVQAIQMSGLQISLLAPHLALPSTSKPPCHADTQ
ncbi:hypothetical protein C1H46_000234 [Malus baccata]|uniref:Uncharacterized protein n=1 Tax=Malus baccata TaxID=106549 RepID=A0A540NTM7_MALBA|nr:hypothetical protein C1H46_000234 [Malus baccata]